jgi:Tfp pilus assembly protein PilV
MKRSSRSRGYSLISVLVAVLVFSLGILGLAGMYGRFLGVVSDDQNLATLSQVGNSFWGVLQASPSVVNSVDGTTYNSGNYTSAPSSLQEWLKSIIVTQATALPDAHVTLTKGPDALGTSGSVPCNTIIDAAGTTKCQSVQVTITWKSVISPLVGGAQSTRSHVFYYQIGL